MISLFRKLWKNKRGNAIVIAGASLPMIVGAAGLASDTIQWTLWKRQLQRAADSAAIAGVYQRQNSAGATTGVQAAVNHDLTLNNHNWMALKSGYPVVDYPAVAGATNTVRVELRIQQSLPFSSMFMSAAPVITAKATAAAIAVGGSACFQAQETGTATGLNFTGNASIEAPDCDGFSNAAGANTSVAKGSSDIRLNSIGGVGGIQQSDNFHVAAYRPYSPAMADPYSNVNPSSDDMKCAQNATTTTTTSTVTVVDTPAWTEPAWTEEVPKKNGKGTQTVYHPAVYHPAVTHLETQTQTNTAYSPRALTDADNGSVDTLRDASGNVANCYTSISVGANRTLVLPSGTEGNPRTYYINGGDLNVQGSLSCDHCTIVLTNKDAASPIGNVKVNASASINMTAPADGKFAGIALFQDRRAPDCNNCNKINGNSGSIIQGSIYFPSQELEYNGTGTTSAICTRFIGRRLNFSGNSATSNKFASLADCAAFGLSGDSPTTIVRLVG